MYNQVAVSAATPDPTPANNTAGAFTTANARADVRIAKSDQPDPVIVGRSLTYTLAITNYGPSQAVGLLVTDTLPAQTTFVSASSGCTYQVAPTSVVCTIASLDVNRSRTFTIVVTVNTNAGSTITNAAQVSATIPDPSTATTASLRSPPSPRS